jgi:hypothetical protein
MKEFKSYKSLEKWLREKTDNEFFICSTKSNILKIVICRNNKLCIYECNGSHLTDKITGTKILNFINHI